MGWWHATKNREIPSGKIFPSWNGRSLENFSRLSLVACRLSLGTVACSTFPSRLKTVVSFKQAKVIVRSLFFSWVIFVDEVEKRKRTKVVSNGTLETDCYKDQRSFDHLQAWNLIWARQHFGRKKVSSGESWKCCLVACCVHMIMAPTETTKVLLFKCVVLHPQSKTWSILEFLAW